MTYDEWLFKDRVIFTRQEKTGNHVRARSQNTQLALLIWRFFCLAYWLGSEINWWYQYREDIYWNGIYLSIWAWYTTGIFFAFVCTAHIRHDFLGEEVPRDSTSFFQLWKLCHMLNGLLINVNIWVTILFWALLFSQGMGLGFIDYGQHLFPITASIVDFSLNRMVVDFNHWHIVLCYGAAYLIFSFVWAKTVKPVYFFATYDSFYSWATLLSILIASTAAFFAIYYA